MQSISVLGVEVIIYYLEILLAASYVDIQYIADIVIKEKYSYVQGSNLIRGVIYIMYKSKRIVLKNAD